MKRIQVPTAESYEIAATEFAPAEPNGQIVLISAATGVTQQFYYNFAAFLARHGFHAYTYDYCGIRQSQTGALKANRATYRSWAQTDFPAMVGHLKKNHPGGKLHLIGHSFGSNSLGLSEVDKEFASKKIGIETRLGAKLFSKQPALQEAILNLAKVYNRSAAFIENPPEDLTVYQIAPETELKTNTTTQNYDVLMNDYNLGLNDGEKLLHELVQSV